VLIDTFAEARWNENISVFFRASSSSSFFSFIAHLRDSNISLNSNWFCDAIAYMNRYSVYVFVCVDKKNLEYCSICMATVVGLCFFLLANLP